MQAARQLSLVRPGEPPTSAPKGRAAKELTWDWCNEHPGYGATPRLVLEIYRIAENGDPRLQCDLFDDLIETDATLRNLFEQREGAIAGKAWSIEPDGSEGDSEAAADVLKQALEALPMAEVFAHQLSANRYGYAASEIDWGIRTVGGRDWVVPVWFANVPARRFRIDRRTDELLLTNDIVVNPSGITEPLTPGKWWVTRLSSTRVARAGLMRTASPLALYKRYGTRDLVVYSEKFGLPQILVRVPENASLAVKATARKVVENFGGDGGAVLEEPIGAPESIKVEIKETTAADSSGTHGTLITICNREMAKLINGSTLTNSSEDSGGASYALGEVHADRTWENTQRDDARLRESFRTQVAAMFVRFNGLTCRPSRLAIQIVRNVEPADLMKLADAAIDRGIDVSISQIRGFSGLYAPIGKADSVLGLKAPAVAPSPPPAPPPANGAADPAVKKPETEEPNVEPDKAPADDKAEKKPSEAKLFEYHLPFVTVNEVRELWLERPPVEGGHQYASEWAAEKAAHSVDEPAKEEP